MTTKIDIEPENDRELVLCRLIDAPRAAVYRAWTEPELLKQFFCPKPWTVAELTMDVRPGGAFMAEMRGPDGEVQPVPGVYLELVPDRRIVFTDAFTEAWKPSDKPFMTASIELEDADGGTRYTARAGHWTVDDRKAHEQMGFHEGWSIVTEQLEELAKTLA